MRLGDQLLQSVALTDQVLTIGRNPDNGLPLANSNQVSRYHADVRLSPEGLLLTDLGSANGTFVGEERLLPHQPRLLTPGALFRIGPFEITFEVVGAPAPDASDPEPDPPAAPKPEPKQEPKPEPAERASKQAPPATGATVEPPERDAVPELVAPAAIVPTDEAASEPEAVPPGDLSRRERLMAGLPSAPPPLPLYNQASRYMGSLPLIFHESDFLRRYLLLFEAIWEPLEYRQDHIQLYFDPRTCPVPLINWLAQWFGLPINPHWPEGRRRQVLAQMFDLYRWRGTRHGLALMIELCTGVAPEIDDGATPFVFNVRLKLPPGHRVARDFLQELIESHKPAHAGYTLELTE